jgi:hypothetical protein
VPPTEQKHAINPAIYHAAAFAGNYRDAAAAASLPPARRNDPRPFQITLQSAALISGSDYECSELLCNLRGHLACRRSYGSRPEK